jgi:hypothetical protein
MAAAEPEAVADGDYHHYQPKHTVTVYKTKYDIKTVYVPKKIYTTVYVPKYTTVYKPKYTTVYKYKTVTEYKKIYVPPKTVTETETVTKKIYWCKNKHDDHYDNHDDKHDGKYEH